ncbi:hypothetical protein, partial [Klebsiella pneumoniae]|uniref:hypothetical protein n=1 Tax=Klebsiella pneumoniae TaxID=573 RepID=UPI003CC84EC4
MAQICSSRSPWHSAARSKGKETPINLLGFKDGTANPASHDSALMDKVVWVTAN